MPIPSKALLPTPNFPPKPNFTINQPNTLLEIKKTHFLPKSNPPLTLSDAEIDEKKSKGLCFWCDEKFFPGHKCQHKKLHMLTIQKVSENQDETSGH